MSSFKEKNWSCKNIIMNTVQYTKTLTGLISKRLEHINLAEEAFSRKLI